MAVTNDTIIQKMINELNQAKANSTDQVKMIKHIENVRLLCDLFVDDSTVDANEISPEEMKAMIGAQTNPVKQDKDKKSIINHDEANGDSLFDF
ncbi:hypothetical protein CIL05_01815 [Virgibacillus profundi]|uniref:YwdI family protein n=1 Tax=Virgibacillus profundi TaxID=2024555 RepID=A0A2A2IJC1_9BACI|nr:YwdI family protein [Virgibacillus profundi]PAV31416.1 hypothetical protein CIL05_01815 [Virgibacillus profundi]PXY55602.1 hypothetical protein CIT14_01825 [Virgibacillus profundi]